MKKFEKDLITKVIPMFLKKCNFVDIKKMSYQISLHTDTDNLHFHFSFCEKKPNYRCTDNTIKYRNKGKLTNKELNFLKNEVEHYIEKEKYFTPLLRKTNDELDILKTYFNKADKNFLLKDKQELMIEYKILKLGELLSIERQNSNNKIKYNSIKNKEIIKLTKEIKTYLFSSKNKDLKNDYKNFKDSLNKINLYFEKINKENNIKEKVNKDLIEYKKTYLNNYVYNAIVNHSYQKYKKRITENEIISEIIYKQYSENKKQSIFEILKCYLFSIKSNKYVNRYKINIAVKNINDELDEACNEFKKLFKEVERYYQ